MKCHIIPLPNEESHQPKQHYYKILLTKKQQQQETRTNVKRQQKKVYPVMFCFVAVLFTGHRQHNWR